MKRNDCDQASRYTALLDPVAFLAWLFHLTTTQFRFLRWLDTRNAPLPRATDRTSDTVALIEQIAKSVTVWGMAIEFQIRPDRSMFFRIFAYLAAVIDRLLKDPSLPKSICVGAAVVNLTSRGRSSRIMDWLEAGVRTRLAIREINMADESAKDLLQEIASGLRPRALLPWIPLMTGGGDADIINKWKKLVSGEINHRRRADYGVLALVFAKAAKRLAEWREALQEWNMFESEVVTEWMQKGFEKGAFQKTREMLLHLGTKKFKRKPNAAHRAILDSVAESPKLETLLDRVLDVDSWDALLSK